MSGRIHAIPATYQPQRSPRLSVRGHLFVDRYAATAGSTTGTTLDPEEVVHPPSGHGSPGTPEATEGDGRATRGDCAAATAIGKCG